MVEIISFDPELNQRFFVVIKVSQTLNYTVDEVSEPKDVATLFGLLMSDVFRNCIFMGDLSAPMNKRSRIFKVVNHKGDIQTGFVLFDKGRRNVIIFPYGMTEHWKLMRNYINSLNLEEVRVVFPLEVDEGMTRPLPPPWVGWDEYKWELEFTDIAMRFTNDELEILSPEGLPELRAATIDDAPRIADFFEETKKNEDPSIGHWFIPEQIESELSVIAEQDGKIVGFAGTHFETPYTVQMGNIYVVPEFRGKGLGRVLSTAVALGIIRTKRVPTLFVNEHNKRAISLYESIGFSKYNSFGFWKGIRK